MAAIGNLDNYSLLCICLPETLNVYNKIVSYVARGKLFLHQCEAEGEDCNNYSRYNIILESLTKLNMPRELKVLFTVKQRAEIDDFLPRDM